MAALALPIMVNVMLGEGSRELERLHLLQLSMALEQWNMRPRQMW